MHRLLFAFTFFLLHFTCFNMTEAQNQTFYKQPGIVFNPDVGDYVTFTVSIEHQEFYASIKDALKEKDTRKLHAILADIRYKKGKNGEYFPDATYLGKIGSILKLLKPYDFCREDAVLRRDVLRLADSAVDLPVHPDYTSRYLPQQLTILMEHVLPNEYHGYIDSSKTLSKPLATKQRPLRLRQALSIWKKLLDEFDESWKPAGNFPPNEVLNILNNIYHLSVTAEAYQMLSHIEDKQQRARLASEDEATRKVARVKIDEAIRKQKKECDVYQAQKDLRRVLPEFEPKLVRFITTLYSMEPHNDDDELRELLKEYETSEDFNKAVFEELEKETNHKKEQRI